MSRFLINTLSMACILGLSPLTHGHDDWQLSGFFTQGINTTSDYNFFGDSDDSVSTDYSEAGINLTHFLNDKIRFTAQLAYRNSNVLDEDEFFLDLLQIDALLHNTENTTTGVKLGLIKFKQRLYDDVYDVSAAWSTAQLPEVLYPQLTRSTLLNFEGIIIHHTVDIENWTFLFNLGAGQRDIESNVVEDLYLYDLGTTTDTKTDEAYTALFEVTNEFRQQKLGIGYLKARWKPEVSLGNLIEASIGSNNDFYTLYLSQGWGPWVFELEASYIESKNRITSIDFPSGFGACNTTCQALLSTYSELIEGQSNGYAGYFTLHRNFPNGTNIYLGYGHSVDNADDIRGKELEQLTGAPNHTAYLKQTFLGFQYQITENWSVASEFSLFEGTSNLSTKENVFDNDSAKHWHSFFTRISYTF
ncbi:hypothetical protein R50073_00780 [Maricurvus nonylphenolicus]|uniref:hypothetical protein n=1 Tax=Maricurvus nonylphenolicus TaxID=1008307 RepID=UPI0036F2B0B9